LTAVSAVVVFAIAIGLWTLGTPQDARRHELDRRRIDDLRSIVSLLAARSQWVPARPLPAELDSVAEWPIVVEAGHRAVRKGPPRDPATGTPYEYRRLDDSRYELCATFDGEVREKDLENWQKAWAHPAGHACYRFDLSGKEGDRFTPVR
jgi:hypothetical protein